VSTWKHLFACLCLTCLVALSLSAQGIRERIRMNANGMKVSGTQAADLTLTLSTVATRSIQQVIRTGGAIDKSHKVITATIASKDAEFVQVGQRVKSFPPESKSSMYQARVTRVSSRDGKSVVEATLSSEGIEGRLNYVMEIIVERGEFLSIPNEAIIEEGDHRIVYVQQKDGSYVPRKIETGFQGELYTQIMSGLAEGEQVVTFGSFFIDSEYKLKQSDQEPGR
jgi:multidrug efflux pump subunit AcrA (membrane-fusion protein)